MGWINRGIDFGLIYGRNFIISLKVAGTTSWENMLLITGCSKYWELLIKDFVKKEPYIKVWIKWLLEFFYLRDYASKNHHLRFLCFLNYAFPHFNLFKSRHTCDTEQYASTCSNRKFSKPPADSIWIQADPKLPSAIKFIRRPWWANNGATHGVSAPLGE